MHYLHAIRSKLVLPADYKKEFEAHGRKYNNMAASLLSALTAILITASMLAGYISYTTGAAQVSEYFIVLPYHILCVVTSAAALIALRVLYINDFAGHWINNAVALFQITMFLILILISGHVELPSTGIKNISVIVLCLFGIGFILRLSFKTTMITETVFFLVSAVLLFFERNEISNFFPSLVNLIASYITAVVSSTMFYALRVEAFCNMKQLETLATYDTLTRLHNRSSFDNFILSEWARAADEGDYLALFLIDIDDFNAYNTNFGREKGDKCLSIVADVISRSVRKNDFVARYSGERFVCALTGVRKNQAEMIASKMMHEMFKCKIAHGNSVTPYVTFSMGCMITRPRSGDHTLPDFIEKANAALLMAKQRGRNRLAVHPDALVD